MGVSTTRPVNFIVNGCDQRETSGKRAQIAHRARHACGGGHGILAEHKAHGPAEGVNALEESAGRPLLGARPYI